MKRVHTVCLVVSLLALSAVASGCGASSFRDAETATEAKAAGAGATNIAVDTTAPEAVAPVDTAAIDTTPSGENAASWEVIDSGAQTFAANLDQANQSIASCETDAAAGASFDACLLKAYTAMAAAAGELTALIGGTVVTTDGACRDAVVTLTGSTQTLVDDYTKAISTTDWTSRDTLTTRLADDAQAYADTAMAAGAACAS